MCWNLAWLNMFARNCMFNRHDVVIQEESRNVGEGSRLVGDVVASITATEAAISSLRLSMRVLCPNKKVHEEIG